jgi:MoxR-like ATPase
VSKQTSFVSPSAWKDVLGKQQYIASDEIATTVFLTQQLGKPLLCEGPAGVGKTELGKGSRHRYRSRADPPAMLRRVWTRPRRSTSGNMPSRCSIRSFLRDKLQETLAGAHSLADAADRLAGEEDVFFSQAISAATPLLKAILSEKPTVLLIDEIDRADAEFEAFLLEVLSDFQVTVPELGTLAAVHRPIVLLTSNNTRELSEALKRRCLYLFIGYPAGAGVGGCAAQGARTEQQAGAPGCGTGAALRDLDLRKSPSISETLDWAKALVALNAQAVWIRQRWRPR